MNRRNNRQDYSDQELAAAEKIVKDIKAAKDYAPGKTSGGHKFILNIDTANEEVHRLSGAKRALILKIGVVNRVIELLRENTPKQAAPLPKPAPSVKPLPTTPARSTPLVPKPQDEHPGTDGVPAKTFPPLRKGAAGIEKAAWANAKAQAEKENGPADKINPEPAMKELRGIERAIADAVAGKKHNPPRIPNTNGEDY